MPSLHKRPNAHEEAPDRPESLFGGVEARTVALVVIAVGVTVFLLQHMESFFAPMAVGLLLFYALDPAVDAMERFRLPRWIGAAVALGLTFGTIGLGAYMLQDHAMTAINQLPTGARRVTALLARDRKAPPGPLQKVEQAAAELDKSDTSRPEPGVVRVQVEEPRVTATSLTWSGSIGAVYAVHLARRMAADADADGPRGVDEPRGGVRRPVVLELGLGGVGHAARRPDDDVRQGCLRPRR
ncbi:MAG: AI-2E family transporter [Acidobacteria bacterium]|nr:AI-2E family transporter [Acidobacteriota bacterium]